MSGFINNISHYGDIIAIPFFLLAVIYFSNIKNRTHIENTLLFFSISGLLFDLFFTFLFLKSK
jgi:hypothetical protein